MTTRAIRPVAALIALVAGFFTIFGALPAHAADLGDVFTDVRVVQTTTEVGGVVRVEGDFTIPDSAQAGDTFTLTLDPAMKVTPGTTFQVTNPDGEVVANAVVDANGVVTFTLTDFVDTHTDVTGSTWVQAQWDRDSTVPEGGSDETVTITTGSKDWTDTIHVNPPSGKPGSPVASKWMGYDADGTLPWVVFTPVITADMVGKTITMTDEAPAGTTLKCADARVQFATAADTAKIVDVQYIKPECTSTTQSATFVVTDAMVGLVGELAGTAVPSDPTQTEWTNRGTVTIDGVTTPVTAERRRTTAGGTADGVIPVSPTPTPTSTPTPSETPSETPSVTPTPSVPATTPTPQLPTTTPTPQLPTTPPSATTPAQPRPQLPHSGDDGSALPAAAVGTVLALAGAALVARRRR